ncbi:hypothetical protein BC833DRAFT_124250 [Globomyces pollinis-pini]|nr:hypothetical protein BC833DRAFT_124250 [Globomyces pollinis-pini]
MIMGHFIYHMPIIYVILKVLKNGKQWFTHKLSLDIRSKIVAEDMHTMKKSDSIHFSMLKRLDSRICIRRCLFPKALDEALSSYRLLSTLLSKSETNSSALKKLTTPIQTSLLLDTLQRICDVYKLQGEPKPLEYYLKVGVDLARKSHSLHFQMLFLTLLADLEVRRDNLTQSKDYLQQVDSLRVSEGNEHVMALYHLKQGDVFSTDDSLVLDAGKEYQRAESIIDELCNPGYTKDFEFQELK